MKNSFPVQPGVPVPLGPSRLQHGINFALFSRHAEQVSLILERETNAGPQRTEIPLDPKINKTGDVWHILLQELPEKFFYGYRLAGPYDPDGSGHRFDDRLVLLDPYTRAIRPAPWGRQRFCLGQTPCSLVPDTCYDWEGDRPLTRPLKDTIIYEMHVRGFTRHPSSGVAHPGTFRGVAEQSDYLRELGITAVELMPVTEFDENQCFFRDPDTGERLKDYWGYNPLSFFAPKSGYASEPARVLDEFRDMVKALHRAGIEVILDMVYNHTAEGGAQGPTLHFKGIDNTIYYLLDPWTRAYLNFSGCGNTCNCNHPVVRSLIMDSLRWWVVEMHVDGFRFDLASILGRDQQGQVLANPPVVEMIAEDPVLADTKIIAEAWDAAGLYQVGSFSTHPRWAEWNGRFRDDVRAFMCGLPGSVPHLATRIAGSSDLYQHSDRRPCNSINFITSHDGFTLWDLVSYNKKHNRINGEDNRDGENNNISWNSGVEGETGDPAINELRRRRIRTMAVILFLSQGVPMLVAGDEFCRTQHGNNNAWCQDNEISWINWELVKKNQSMHRFFQHLVALRKAHPIFRRDDFFVPGSDPDHPPQAQEIIWQAREPGMQDWSEQARILAFTLNGATLPPDGDDDFFVMLNGHRTTLEHFLVPPPPEPRTGRIWHRIIDTADSDSTSHILKPDQAPVVRPGTWARVAPMGCVVLQSRQGANR